MICHILCCMCRSCSQGRSFTPALAESVSRWNSVDMERSCRSLPSSAAFGHSTFTSKEIFSLLGMKPCIISMLRCSSAWNRQFDSTVMTGGRFQNCDKNLDLWLLPCTDIHTWHEPGAWPYLDQLTHACLTIQMCQGQILCQWTFRIHCSLTTQSHMH